MNLFKSAAIGLAIVVLGLGVAVAVTPVEDKTVQITDSGFVPDKMDVTVGQKVVWKNMTQKEHTVTAKSKSGEPGQDKPLFDSGPIKAGGSWEYTFTKEGTFDYSCTLHPKMVGSVSVKATK